MGGGGGEGESIRGCFSFSYKKYKWHFYQKNLPGGGGGGVRWAVGRGVVKESKKKNGISVYMRSMNGISNRRTCQVEGEAQ